MNSKQRQILGKPGFWMGLAYAWSFFIVLICLVPLNPGPPSVIPLDKLVHLLMFAGFAGLWLRVYPRSHVRIAIAGLLLGLGIEIAQSALDWGRYGDGWDFLADGVGLLLGVAADVKLGRARNRYKVD